MKHSVKKSVRSDGANAFIAEPGTQNGRLADDLSEYLGENFVSSATGGEDSDEKLHDDPDVEEFGGPFIETDARAQFGSSLEPDAAIEPGEPEAFPTAIRSGKRPARRPR